MKKKILEYFIGTIALAIVSTALLVTVVVYRVYQHGVMNDLAVYSSLLSMQMQNDAVDVPVLPDMTQPLRVTVIGQDGTVLADNLTDAKTMENHGDRLEVRLAFETGHGEDTRCSETVGKRALYYAVKLENGNVLRTSLETGSLLTVFFGATPLLLVLLLAMFLLCALTARKLTDKLVQPIGEMTTRLDEAGTKARYPELEPFMTMLHEQHEEILRSANMRVEFTANVSHELKTPLTSISGYAELIESGMAQGEQTKVFAGEIHKSANRLLTLINDIIRLSQMDAPMQDIQMEPVDMGQVAGSALEQLDLSAKRLGVNLQLDARSAMVNADRQMMEELIYNLCDNAIRYNVRGGSVCVSVRHVRDHVIVCVQDTGIGISQENQAHVFERFYRVDKSRSKATGGTGLGLAIVKHIAAKHNAKISLSSELGIGTTISVTFARAR